MALEAKDLKISFDLDEFTWGDMEDLRRPGGLLDVCSRLAVIEGVDQEDNRATLRKLSVKSIKAIDSMLSQAIDEWSNPTNGAGKN